MDLKRLTKKYSLTPSDLECVYYDVFNKTKRFGENFDALFGKFLYDRLEELNMENRDIESLVDHYTRIMEDYTARQPVIVKKILDGEEAEQVIDEEMQISGFVSDATEGRRKAGYKIEPSEEYSE